MKKLFTAFALTAGVFATSAFIASSAQAATLNFSDFASENEGGVENESTFSVNGVKLYHLAGYALRTDDTLIHMRTAVRGKDPLFSYYDDDFEGRPGGLGVCRVLEGAAGTTAPGAECLDPSDDSIDGGDGLDEAILLQFVDGLFDITELSFRDGDHHDISNSDGLVEWGIASQDGVMGGITTFAELVAMAIAGEFTGVRTIALGYVDTEFYLSSMSVSEVPIPGAIPLLMSGLAGLGFATRKTKKKVA